MNRELVLLYWSIGRDLSRRFENEGWGTKINQRLADDLQAAFPGVEGFSPRNLRYMRSFAEAWPDPAILQQLIAKLPWGHNLRVLDRIKDRPTREWYLRAALEHGWSQNVLVHMISGQLHEREGKALSNFQRTLPPPGSDMAERILRDPYNFDFLTLAEPFAERELEKGAPDAPSRPATRARPRIRIHRKPSATCSERPLILCGPAFLSCSVALLLRD